MFPYYRDEIIDGHTWKAQKQAYFPTDPEKSFLYDQSEEYDFKTEECPKFEANKISLILFALKIGQLLWKYKKDILNFIGAQFIKIKDSKGVIARMDFYFNKIKYSLRYSIKDFKWHIINLDNRHAKIDNEFLNKLLNSDVVIKFKKYCLKVWNKIFKGQTSDKKSPFLFILDNSAKFKLNNKSIKFMTNIGNNYKTIEKHFQ